MSWLEYPDKLIVRYEDLVSQPSQALRRICNHVGLEVSGSQIDSAIEYANKNGKRKNKVSPGRGKSLPPDDIAQIVKMSNYYPNVDFTTIGIPDAMRQTNSHLRTSELSTSHVFWLTGLPGAGKTTVARAFKKRLDLAGEKSVVLDGDELREGINADLGFTEVDRNENVRRVAEIASLFEQTGHVVIVSLISPTPGQRETARRIIGENFVEVFIDTPIDVCESRDPKGNYHRARQGRISGFTGVSSPYIPPLDPDLVIHAATTSVEEAVDALMNRLRPL